MKLIYLFIVFMLPLGFVYPQSGFFSNINVTQRKDGSGLIDIYYSLEGTAPFFFVRAEASFDGAIYSPIPAADLSGDFGPVSAGSGKHIIWYGLQSFPNICSIIAKVKLAADTIIPSGSTCLDLPIVIYGNQVYHTVQIGTQCWLKENLNIGNQINGGLQQLNNGIIEKYCYNNEIMNCSIYGGLYCWDEVMNYSSYPEAPGICPQGWHIPTKTEYQVLIDFSGGSGIAGGALKETGTTHWVTPNTGATNSTGFSALPSGDYYLGFFAKGTDADYWTSTPNSLDAWNFRVNHNDTFATIDADSKQYERAVRCIKDQ